MSSINPEIADPKILDHDLNQYFPELLKFESIEETEASDVYKKIKPTVARILGAVVGENFAPNPKSEIPNPNRPSGPLPGTSSAGTSSRAFWTRSKITTSLRTRTCCS